MGRRESFSEMSEGDLGNKLYKSLFGRRYLIVLDDIWSIEAWEKVKTFFPNNNDGSAIMLTTRLSNLAFKLSGSCQEMSFLDENKSWKLFCKSTFGGERCPPELEDIGKKIVENCKGLPLSIVVVGGLLAKSKQTRKYWYYIAENLNSIVNLENNEHCFKILHLSYKELPIHLKPCFLYMSVYPEDSEIDVPQLIKLWVAEGFLKPISGRSLEEVANEYFNELVGRNLILVNERGYSGKTIKCKVHDLLVDLCVRETKKHKFLFVPERHKLFYLEDLNTQRRIVVHDSTIAEVIHDWLSHHETLVRSLTIKYCDNSPKSFNSKLLRVLRVINSMDASALKSFNRIVNCRYISGVPILSPYSPNLPSSFCLFWNLQTLEFSDSTEVETSEIWKMSQLRHVYYVGLDLLDPPNDEGDDYFVLGNLQTLSGVIDLKFSEDVVKRIPNIKLLGVHYNIVDWSSCCLNNLVQLINLESLSFSLTISRIPSELLESLSFPRSLKELNLRGIRLDWDDMGTKIGSLPHLQVLRLFGQAFVGDEWETVEGQFRSLKCLEMAGLCFLKHWRTESWTHFPCLEHLGLFNLKKLKEIPSEIGETLKSIEMYNCSDSAIFSAKEIVNEQESLGNEGLQVKVEFSRKRPDMESLAAPNFQVKCEEYETLG